MFDHKVLIPTMAAVALLFASPARSQFIDEVEPRQGFIDETTKVAVLGSDFESGSRVLLRPGGPDPLSELPMPVRAGRFSGDRAVLVRPGEISVIDVTDPENPLALGQGALPVADAIVDVVVDGGRAYVMLGFLDEEYGGFWVEIVDVQDPADLRRLGMFYVGPWTSHSDPVPQDLKIDGTRGFVLWETGGLTIWNVESATRPSRLGSIQTSGTASDVESMGETAYVSGGDTGMEIIDISNPAEPVSLGFVAELDEAWDLALAPPYGYVAAGEDGVRVYDFTDPRIPQEIGAPVNGMIARGILFDGARAFTLPGLEMLSLADPVRPEAIRRLRPSTSLPLLDATEDLILFGNTLYATNGPWGADEVVAVVPASGKVDRSPPGAAFHVHGGGGTTAVAIEDPARPVVLGSGSARLGAKPGFYFTGSTVLGGLTYAAYSGTCYRADGPSYSCAELFRIDPESDPTPTRGDHATGWTRRIASDERSLYLMQEYFENGLPSFTWKWLEVREGAEPWYSASYVLLDESFNVSRMAVSDGLVFLSGSGDGVIVDARDPSAPFLAAEVDFPFGNVEVLDDLAYVSGDDLRIMDLTNAAEPSIVASVPVPGSASVVSHEGTRLLVSTALGITEVDVSWPLDPEIVRLAGTTATDAEPVDDDHLLLGGGQIIRLNPRLGGSTVDPERIQVEVPPGFAPGLYDVVILQENGAAIESRNAFLACERRDLQADLVPVTGPNGFPDRPPQFTVDLGGDPALFKDVSTHEVALRLPELPVNVEVRFESGDGFEGTRIDLWIAPSAGSALAIVFDDDRARAERVWNEAREAGRFRLPHLDARTYGPVTLSLGPIPDRPAWTTLPVPGDLVGLEGPADRLRFRYDVVEDHLIAARAAGVDADLVVEAVARDDVGCLFEAAASLLDAVASWCEDATGGFPVVIRGCPPSTEGEIATGLTGR